MQEKILSCIRTDGEHDDDLLMVRGVEQPIYKFRRANPSSFTEKYDRFSSSENESDLHTDLSQNFRLRQEVLSTINYLLKHMMNEQVGEISYDDAAQLYFDAPYDEVSHPVQLRAPVETSSGNSDSTGSE